MPISKRTAIGFIAGNQEAIEKVYLEYKISCISSSPPTSKTKTTVTMF